MRNSIRPRRGPSSVGTRSLEWLGLSLLVVGAGWAGCGGNGGSGAGGAGSTTAANMTTTQTTGVTTHGVTTGPVGPTATSVTGMNTGCVEDDGICKLQDEDCGCMECADTAFCVPDK